MPDIDLDFPNRAAILDLIEHVPAVLKNGKKHNTGIYCQKIPKNPLTGLSSIEYKEAEARGYFKIDFLNVNVYNSIRDEDHLINLLETEPLWDLLEQDEFVDLLFHVSGHGSILRKMKPRTIEQLAAVLAMIRPGKKHLIGQDWNSVMKEIWIKPTGDEYYFKKAHAISYAMVVIVHMNLICESLSYEYS
jgi:DNA polymerase III alpha subunit